MATILRYWQYPKKLQASTEAYTTETRGLAIPAIDADTVADYDWENMLPTYPSGGSFTEAQRMAVARLMYHCGVVVQADYYSHTSAYLATADQMAKYFGFDKDLAMDAVRTRYSLQQWCHFLDTDLQAGRPILYSGHNEVSGGHEFVVDGADGKGLYHVDWGWNGGENGYFDISILNPPSTPSGYGGYMTMTVGLQPDNGQEDEPLYTLPQRVNSCSYTVSRATRANVEETFSLDATLYIATLNRSGFTGDIAFGLKKSDGTYDVLAQKPVTLPDATTEDGSVRLDFSIDYAFPEGVSEMCFLSRAQDGQDWERCAYKVGDMLMLYASADSLSILPSRLWLDSLVLQDDISIADCETRYSATFTNISSEEYNGTFTYAHTDAEDNLTSDSYSYLYFNLAPGESVTKTISITPKAATCWLVLWDMLNYNTYSEYLDTPMQNADATLTLVSFTTNAGSNLQETTYASQSVKMPVIEDDKVELTAVFSCEGKEGNTIDTYYHNVTVTICGGDDIVKLGTVQELVAFPVGGTLTKTISIGKDIIGDYKTLTLMLNMNDDLVVPDSLNWTLEGYPYDLWGNWRVVYLTGEPTGISIPAQDTPAAGNGALYTISGQRARHAMRSGIYIRNGRKFVVR